MTIPKCTSWLGHRFQGRFSTEPPVMPVGDIPYSPAVDELHLIISRLTAQIYERDICVRCGHVIEREYFIEDGER